MTDRRPSPHRTAILVIAVVLLLAATILGGRVVVGAIGDDVRVVPAELGTPGDVDVVVLPVAMVVAVVLLALGRVLDRARVPEPLPLHVPGRRRAPPPSM